MPRHDRARLPRKSRIARRLIAQHRDGRPPKIQPPKTQPRRTNKMTSDTEQPKPAAADGGPRGSGTGAQQLTRGDLASMTPEAIDAARISGQLDQLLGRQ